MRRPFVLLALLGALLAPAVGRAAEAVTPPGGSFGLVPPSGFVPSDRYSGFEDRATGSSIILSEMPAGAYAEISGATAESFGANGMTLLQSEDFPTAAGVGRLFALSQQVSGIDVSKWLLVFPGPSYTGLVTVTVPAVAIATVPESLVRYTLGTIVVERQKTLAEAADALPFTFQETEQLHLVATLAGISAVLTIGPRTESAGVEQPMLVIASSFGEFCGADRREASERVLRASPQFRDVRILEVRDVTVAGAPGVELHADALDQETDLPVQIVQWTGFFESGCIRLLGRSLVEDAAVALAEFRKVLESVALRSTDG